MYLKSNRETLLMQMWLLIPHLPISQTTTAAQPHKILDIGNTNWGPDSSILQYQPLNKYCTGWNRTRKKKRNGNSSKQVPMYQVVLSEVINYDKIRRFIQINVTN